jgi:diadenosine tetraphosphatase ApaH/serine/threonine PP2A family protein phosphatase
MTALSVGSQDQLDGMARGYTPYKKLKELWAYLPHAVLVEGRYLMLHGGLPRNVFSAKDIAFAHETASSNFEEILWSDPVEDKGYFHSLRGPVCCSGKMLLIRFFVR